MISSRIKKIRKEKELTQINFGKRIGVAGNTVTNYENGLREPSNAVLLAISREFSVNYSWLKDGTGEMFIESDGDLIVLIDDIVASDNIFAKTILRALTKFDEADWLALERIIDKISDETKKN